jgi:uncharacterized protein (DUF2252 family)
MTSATALFGVGGSAAERIRAHNAGRDPALLARKYEKMSAGPFAFFRGSCHLFYEDWRAAWPEELGPAAFIVGDLHVENFGAFKTLGRNLRYDINDFDEALVGYPALDVARLLSSIDVAGRELGVEAPARRRLLAEALSGYAAALAALARSGAERFLDEKSAPPPVAALLDRISKRTRHELLEERTSGRGAARRLRRGAKLLDIPAEAREELAAALARFAADAEARHSLKPLDAGFRVAGTGSLGIRRYAALIEGKGGDDGQLILDIKEALPSSLLLHLPPRAGRPAAAFAHEAERVVRAQRALQGDSPAYLGYLALGGRWFVCRELQPTDDRLSLTAAGGRGAAPLAAVVGAAARLSAWAHARAALEGSSASSGDLAAFGAGAEPAAGGWGAALLEAASAYGERVAEDHAAFAAAYKKGFGA